MVIGSYFSGRLLVKVGDLTEEDTDAIVNAANSTLLGGGGVDGAIHSKGGPEILKECRALRSTKYPDGLPVGKAVITTAGRLPARYVIHTVGPIFGRDPDNQARLLSDCYKNSLDLAVEHGLGSVAFPSISTGAYGYPKAEAASIAAQAVKDKLAEHKNLAVRLVFRTPGDALMFMQSAEIPSAERDI